MLLFGPGLIRTQDGRFVLTENGHRILVDGSPDALYELFEREWIGFAELVELLNQEQPLSDDALGATWIEHVRNQFGVKWKTSHARMQFKHRIEFLRSLSVVKKVADSYFLTEKGMQIVSKKRRSEATTREEAEAVSHNEIEDKLRLIGEFFEFMSVKRASINHARPPQAQRLKEERQLDCLWARVINFGGKVQYAFEVQVSGSVADAIERLEMVASFVQKAIVVTDEDQSRKIRDRLDVKHSPLRDKILFLSYDDINSVAEAVSALTVFTGKVFRE